MIDMPRGRPSNKPRSEFGRRLAEARRRAGLSQTELGERMGMTQRAIAHWERRNVSLYPRQVEKLCRILGISAEELLGFNTTSRGKPGPKSKIERQVEQIGKLPRSRQKFVAEVLDRLLTAEKE